MKLSFYFLDEGRPRFLFGVGTTISSAIVEGVELMFAS